jgi:hypothetical protein
MRLILAGIEYVGKHTLGGEISRWWAGQTGIEVPPDPAFHDHFTLPNVVHFGEAHDNHRQLSAEQMLTLNPGLAEQYQRWGILGKLSSGYIAMTDLFIIDWYYSDAVYAPIYHGYGDRGQYADRRTMARGMDSHVNQIYPDMVLVLMTASPETIRQRVQKGDSPFPDRHVHTRFQEKDTEVVLDRFQEEYDTSLLPRKFILDTTDASVEESLAEFKQKIKPHVTTEDKVRLLSAHILDSW